jgi:hypothetical protein
MTKFMRELEEDKKAMKYEKIVIRVHFRNRMVLQALFRPKEPGLFFIIIFILCVIEAKCHLELQISSVKRIVRFHSSCVIVAVPTLYFTFYHTIALLLIFCVCWFIDLLRQ